MSTISSGNTTTTAFVVTGDTTGNLVFSTTGGLINAASSAGGFVPPTGTTAQRNGTPASGEIRYNTTTGCLEAYNGSSWINLTPSSSSFDNRIGSGRHTSSSSISLISSSSIRRSALLPICF